jgi:hypothetical protein
MKTTVTMLSGIVSSITGFKGCGFSAACIILQRDRPLPADACDIDMMICHYPTGASKHRIVWQKLNIT